jgi:hypothetical protein
MSEWDVEHPGQNCCCERHGCFAQAPTGCDCVVTPAQERLRAVAAACWRAGCDEKDGQNRIQGIIARHTLSEAARLSEVEAERDRLRQQLGDILARIHRDGGHYIAEHGWEKALADADIELANMLDWREVEKRTQENLSAALSLLSASKAGPERNLCAELGELLEGVPVCFCMTCKHQAAFGSCATCRCGNKGAIARAAHEGQEGK